MDDAKKALEAEFQLLNDEVEAAIKKRKEWIAAHLEDFSKFKPGDEIWDGRSGRKLGVCESLYHATWGRSGEVARESMGVYAQYRSQNGFMDNTSRQMDIWPCTKAEAESYAESRLRSIKAGYGYGLLGS